LELSTWMKEIKAEFDMFGTPPLAQMPKTVANRTALR